MATGESLGEATLDITGNASGANKAVDDVKSHLGASIFIFRTAGYALQSIGQAALSGFTDASKAAGDFNATLVKTQNLTAITDFDINKVHDSLLRMAQETGKTPKELADGFYFAASVLNSLNDALAVTEVAARGSAVGLGNVSDVTRVLTSVMNVYGFTAKDTNHLMDVLVTMVKEGAGEADQFAGAIGRIIPIAKVAGVSFEDVAAALSTATRAGLSVDEATTAVNRTLTELIGTSQQTNKELFTLGFSQTQIDDAMQALATTTGSMENKLHSYGLKTADVSLIMGQLERNTSLAEATMRKHGLTTGQITAVEQTHEQSVEALRKKLIPYGLTLQDIDKVLAAYSRDTEEGRLALGRYGIASEELRDILKQPGGLYTALTMIMEKTQGNEAELRRIFPNIRGFIGILATAGTQGTEYKKILDEMNTSQNVLNTAFEKTAQTQAFAAAKAQATLDTLKIRAGESLAPALIAVLNAVTPLLVAIGDFAAKHPKAFEVITLGLFGMAAGVYALGAAAQAVAGILAISRSITFLVEAGSKVPFLVSAFGMLGRSIAVAGAFLLGTGGAIILLIAGIILIGYLLITHWEQLSSTVKGLGELLGTFFVLVWGKVKTAIGGFFDWLGTQTQGVLDQVGAAFSAFGTTMHRVWDNIVKGVGDAFNLMIAIIKSLPSRAWNVLLADVHAVGFALGWAVRKYFIEPFLGLVDFIQKLPMYLQIAWMAIPIIAQVVWGLVTSKTVEWATNFWSWLQGMWRDGVKAVRDFVMDFPGFIARIWLDSFDWTVRVVTATWNWVVNHVKGSWHDLGEILLNIPGTINEIWKTVKQYTIDRWTELKNSLIGRGGIWDTIIGFLENLGPQLWRIAEQVAGSFWDGFKEGLGIRSPSYIEKAFFSISDAAKAAVGDVNGAIGVMSRATPTLTFNSRLALAAAPAGGVSTSSTGSSGNGLSIGSMTVYHPKAEVDLISALQRQQYLARTFAERGIAPPVVKE